MRFYLAVLAVLASLSLSLSACGDDDYGKTLDLGQDLSATPDLSKKD